MKEYRLFLHVTDGGAIYLVDNDMFAKAKIIIRLDGGAELLRCDIDTESNMLLPDELMDAFDEEIEDELNGDYTRCSTCPNKITWEMFALNTGMCVECNPIEEDGDN